MTDNTTHGVESLDAQIEDFLDDAATDTRDLAAVIFRCAPDDHLKTIAAAHAIMFTEALRVARYATAAADRPMHAEEPPTVSDLLILLALPAQLDEDTTPIIIELCRRDDDYRTAWETERARRILAFSEDDANAQETIARNRIHFYLAPFQAVDRERGTDWGNIWEAAASVAADLWGTFLVECPSLRPAVDAAGVAHNTEEEQA